MLHLHERFASALRSAREAAGWSQADLAHRVGLSVEAYGRLERGRVLARAATLVRLSGVLRISIEQLLGLRSPHGDDDTHLRGLYARFREATAEDARLLLAILGELQRWRKDTLESARRDREIRDPS